MQKLKITEMNRLTPEEFRKAEKTPLVVVLDNVRSLHNVGSVLRTADAFRVEAVYLCGITSTPPHAEIHKTALGAEDSVVVSVDPHATIIADVTTAAVKTATIFFFIIMLLLNTIIRAGTTGRNWITW